MSKSILIQKFCATKKVHNQDNTFSSWVRSNRECPGFSKTTFLPMATKDPVTCRCPNEINYHAISLFFTNDSVKKWNVITLTSSTVRSHQRRSWSWVRCELKWGVQRSGGGEERIWGIFLPLLWLSAWYTLTAIGRGQAEHHPLVHYNFEQNTVLNKSQKCWTLGINHISHCHLSWFNLSIQRMFWWIKCRILQ